MTRFSPRFRTDLPQREGVNLPFELEGHYVTESGAGQSQGPN